MRFANIYLIAILLLNFLVQLFGQVYYWNYVPDGGGEGRWMVWLGSPLIYWPSLLVLVSLWLHADAKHRHIALPMWTFMGLSIVFPVGIPIYYFRSNPLPVALRRLGLFFLFTSACFAVAWLGYKLAFSYYAVWTNKPYALASVSGPLAA